MRTTLRHLVTDTTVSFNQCIACDQELAIYQSLRKMMKNIPRLNKSRNRLANYHLLTQEWVAKVIVTVNGKEVRAILNSLTSILSSFF